MDENNNLQANQPAAKSASGFSITSLVLGIVSIVFLCIPVFPILTSIAGLILGIVGMSKNKLKKGMAIAGIIISAVALLIAIIYVILLAVGIASGFWQDIMDQIESSSY